MDELIQLKAKAVTHDPRLDRLYQLDLRSLNYRAMARPVFQLAGLKKPRGYTWSVGAWLDQGQEGACVGFGFGHDLVARPVAVEGVNNQKARQNIYWPAQQADEWEGGSYPGATPFYEGTSVLAGAQVLTSLGYYEGYDWGLTAQEVAHCIGYLGPAVLGINMREGMMEPDSDGFLNITGEIVGGHCILAYSVKICYKGIFGWLTRNWGDVNWDKSYIKVWNSWGPSWGEGGTAKIRLRDLKQLIDVDKGEACFPRRNPLRTAF